MKSKVYFLLFASLMMVGANVMSSCSNDEKSTEPEQTQNAENLRQQLENTVSTVNQGMSELDFAALAPLATAIAENEGEETDETQQKFNGWLQKLLQQLNKDFSHKLPFGFTLGFEAVENVFQRVWSVSGLYSFGREDGHGWIKNGTSLVYTSDYTARDKSLYHVTLEERFDNNLVNLVVGHGSERRLTVLKDGEQVLAIRSVKEMEHQVIGILPSLKLNCTGEILYKEFVVSLGFSRPELHNRIIELRVNKGETVYVKATTSVTNNLTLSNILRHDVLYTSDSDISVMGDLAQIILKVNNLNKFIGNVATLLFLRDTGTTEEKCKEFADKFNENMNANLLVAGSDAGKLIVASTLDEKKGKYIPSFFIISPLFSDEPVDINTMLANLGISLDDIMSQILGGGDDDDAEEVAAGLQ